MTHPIFDYNDYSDDAQKAKDVINLPPGWTPEEIELAPVNNLIRQARNTSLSDTAPIKIYQTMIKAGVILDYIGEKKAMTEEYLDEREGYYKWKFAKESIQQDDDNVSNGERLARTQDDVLEARNEKSAAKGYQELLENKYETVEKIYYAYKARYERLDKDFSRTGDGEL